MKYSNLGTCWMALWGRCKYRDIFSIFFAVTIIAGLIYYLIGQLIDIKKSSNHLAWNSKLRINDTDAYAETYQILTNLGFVKEPVFFNSSKFPSRNLPVFVLFVESQQVEDLYNFLESFRLYFPEKKLVLYDLGIPEKEYDVISRSCRCEIRGVKWNLYPPHVRNYIIKAFRPITIQMTLREFGMVFWCDPSMRFISSEIQGYISQAETQGLVSWARTQFPTSALSHYNTFRYFHANHSDFYFHHFVQPNMALYVYTENVHKHLMHPWVTCALDKECIAPVGSQPGGCNFQHRPKYMYVGCHHYDASAFNIVLGLWFKLEIPYLGSNDLFTLSGER